MTDVLNGNGNGLNRTFMELKPDTRSIITLRSCVLIAPLWN